ncbi:MAG: indole-3-glycerol phosphate synthase TrpC, partial [Ginsengibacter sp.]
MNILEKIIADKKIEVKQKKKFIPEAFLRAREEFREECCSLKYSLLEDDATGIIAEFKRKSPSKGWINKDIDTLDVVSNYEIFGASGVSILTDEIYFGGTLDDLINGRNLLDVPILRKDFIIDEYQIIETKAWGADVLLLIASCLTRQEVKKFSHKAQQIGLEVLLEIHNEDELDHICDTVDMVGINNRDLKTFTVDLNHSIELSKSIPAGKVKIAESGIDDVATVKLLRQQGFQGFLIGEKFMKEKDPGHAFKMFVKKLSEK